MIGTSAGTTRIADFRDGASAALILCAGLMLVAWALTWLLPERAAGDGD